MHLQEHIVLNNKNNFHVSFKVIDNRDQRSQSKSSESQSETFGKHSLFLAKKKWPKTVNKVFPCRYKYTLSQKHVRIPSIMWECLWDNVVCTFLMYCSSTDFFPKSYWDSCHRFPNSYWDYSHRFFAVIARSIHTKL